MVNLIALYRGDSVGTARLVAVTADPGLVAEVASRLLGEKADTGDPVLAARSGGVRKALQLILREIRAPGRSDGNAT